MKYLREIKITLIALLVWALMPFNPYGYYTILKILVCAGSSYLGVVTLRAKFKPDAAWVYFTIAVIYNPLIPFHFGRPLWGVINLATVVALIATGMKNQSNS